MKEIAIGFMRGLLVGAITAIAALLGGIGAEGILKGAFLGEKITVESITEVGGIWAGFVGGIVGWIYGEGIFMAFLGLIAWSFAGSLLVKMTLLLDVPLSLTIIATTILGGIAGGILAYWNKSA